MKQEIKERVERIQKGEVPEGYKETKIGIIPDDWGVIKLKEIGSFSKGKGISKSDVINCGKGCIRYGEIYTSHHIFIKNFKSFINDEDASNSKLISKGDILFAGSGETAEEIGKAVCYMMDDEAYAGGDIIILSPKNKNNYFYGYVLNNDLVNKQTRIKGQGQSVVHIYSKDLELVRIPKPFDYEEKKIAEIISTWDKAIELKEKLIEEKKEFKRGLMQKLLTGKVRFPEFTDDWTEYQLKDICKFMKGSGLSKEKLSIYGEKKCILYGELYTTYSEVIQEVKSKTNIVEGVPSQKGDVLIPASTTTSGIDLANATALEENSVLLGGDINILRNDKSLFNSSFLAHYLTHVKKFDLASKAQGMTIVHLYGKHLKKIQIDMPQVKEQEKIVQVLSIQDDEIEILAEKLLQLKQQKRGLMQLLLTGIVRVEVD